MLSQLFEGNWGESATPSFFVYKIDTASGVGAIVTGPNGKVVWVFGLLSFESHQCRSIDTAIFVIFDTFLCSKQASIKMGLMRFNEFSIGLWVIVFR